MPDQDLDRLSSEQLRAKIKTLAASLKMMGIICVLYVLFYCYLFVTGTFDTQKHLLGLVPLAGLGLIAYVSNTRIGELKQKLNKRQ